MNFILLHADMDGGLENPRIAIAAVILALAFHGASVLWRRVRPSAPPA
ncbi:hypothetical protein [Archangium lansingense]|uniref:Uncharacterized protein n=1 Tax=Archangium lansingense TaxID=2995310 RepID=A0ABT4APF7_9BACT|nr:hypothetical protein [Archangium lansinium]MCY1083588.1 hypothetical protein [Archangium lansinium]